MMSDSTTDGLAVIDAEVAAAESEAREAEALVRQLENRVIEGDATVTPDQISAQESLSRFARLRAQFTVNKAAKAQEAARLQACEALNAEIAAHAKDDGRRFSDQLKTAVDALRAFHDAVEERNVKVREFRQRAQALGVPEQLHTGPVPATHGGVRLTPGGDAGMSAGVKVGRLRVDGVDADTFMNRALDLLVREGKLKILGFIDAGEDLFGDLVRIDEEVPENTAKHFYRGPNGTVFRKDDPFTADEIKRAELTVITKAEADAE
ncbi:hypothetical protein SAMN04487914_13248 [Arthrobacter sp. ok909]|uniref:hypothetical protein n=1 Tax=Arthrobacter sp. ok909 TaxID=1761746 RepID=UPI00088FA2B0|nr:hypothetical protein [Arthrobacter sp. ok909]SDP74167.1 hypothetical protein SAMN04487914_13248 [Arthrobacter sp. ok909]